MEALPGILESMRLSLVAIAGMVAFSFTITTIMLFRQSKMLRDISQNLANSEVILKETHDLTVKGFAILENVTRLVVHPGRT